MSVAMLARKRGGPAKASPSMVASNGLRIGEPDSALEHEAARMANEIMAMGPSRFPWSLGQMSIASPSRRECDCGGPGCNICGKGQPSQRVSSHSAGTYRAPSIVQEVLRSPGRQLDKTTRNFFEPRFGHDFGAVQVHSDHRAGKSVKAIGALAYSVADHVVLGEGQTLGGRLLAHELVHTLQPFDGFVRRTPDPAVLVEYDRKAAAIRALDKYKVLDAAAKAIADEIMTKARTTDRAVYYIDNLNVLFNTPYDPPAKTGASTRAAAATNVANEKARLETDEGKRLKDQEENASKASEPRFIKRRGQDGKTFEVDNTDPNNIVVRLKIHLTPTGKGKPKDVQDVKSLEDAIEKRASVPGYTVDIVFVKRGGLPDVFEVGVDPDKWVDSGNFRADNTLALAHEVQHLLGLDDRYDYIKAHSTNRQMDLPDRLYWFREQINRDITIGPDPHASESIMGSGRHPLDDDVCKVSGLDMKKCMEVRKWGF